MHPIDPQTNGLQLFYGLRYQTHIVKPGAIETYHDQVGYTTSTPNRLTWTRTLCEIWVRIKPPKVGRLVTMAFCHSTA